MAREKQKFRMYEGLAAAAPQILDDARKAAADLGLAQPGSDFEVHLNGGARRNVLKPYEPLSRPADAQRTTLTGYSQKPRLVKALATRIRLSREIRSRTCPVGRIATLRPQRKANMSGLPS